MSQPRFLKTRAKDSAGKRLLVAGFLAAFIAWYIEHRTPTEFVEYDLTKYRPKPRTW